MRRPTSARSIWHSTTARRLYLETSGIPFFQQLEVIFPNDPANAATAEEFERIKLEGYFDEPLFDDAADTVGAICRPMDLSLAWTPGQPVRGRGRIAWLDPLPEGMFVAPPLDAVSGG